MLIPTIRPNRRRVDDRFPSLGFWIDTAGRPFFEVRLATAPALLDDAGSAQRSKSTYFSSKDLSGLLPAAQADHPYLVPSAVLRTFAAATPGMRAIYFTAVSYGDAAGSGPAFALDPATLRTAAPSVDLASDFTGRTLATVLGVSVEKLSRYGGRSLEAPAAAPVLSETDDALEGEDGFNQVPPIVAAQVARAPGLPAAQSEAFGEDGDFELALLPAMPVTHSSSRSKHADPVLPGQPIRQHSAFAMAQGEDFQPGEGIPDYLQGDDSGDDSVPETRDAALDLEPHYGDYESLEDPNSPAAQPLTIDDKMRIIDRIAPFESGGDYGAINADGEFEGRFGTSHPAYQRYHVGLSYGLIQFTQDSGKLGELLSAMRTRDAAAFATTFGPDADQLIQVTTAAGSASSASPDGRSARVQPVGGADLWREPWVSRFRAAAQIESFRAAQREIAAKGYLDPMTTFAGRLGLDSERALTIAVDRAVQMGPGGAKRWIIDAVGPVASDALRSQALAALGYSDLRSFQAASPGLQVDGEFGPETHAALVAALRRLGPAAPVPVPTTDQMVATMLRRAAGEPWHERIEALGRATIPDTRFAL